MFDLINKDCKTVLDALIQDLANQGSTYTYTVEEISKLAGLQFHDAKRIAEHLADEECLYRQEKKLGPRGHTYTLPAYTLTERGKCYKAMLRQKRIDYIKDKWIDVLASIISLIALIVSIIALNKP